MSQAPDPLHELYPFHYGGSKDAASDTAGLLESVRQKAAQSVEVEARFFADHGDEVLASARAMAQVFRGGGRLFSMGNGGSSCDASHIAVEFVHPVTAGRPSLPAVDLGADRASLTAVANDVGFEHVFVRPLIAQARRGDGLIGISTSGRSANLMRAFEQAKRLGLVTFGLAGMQGGAMAEGSAVDHLLVVEHDSIHRIQECHVAIYHILWDLVHTLLADDRGGPA